MVVKNVIVKGKKVYIRTHNEANGKTRTYHLGKTKVFTNVVVTNNGFKANVLARDGNLAVMNITVNRNGKVVGAVIDHPKVHLNIVNTKNGATVSVRNEATVTDWQIATDTGFTNIVSSSTNDTINKTSYTPPTPLSLNTTYYVRCRSGSVGYGIKKK